ncbi:Deoxyribodipyrimidine photo-lyase [compost metagenome]
MILFIHRKDLRIDDMTAFDYIRNRQTVSLHILIIDPHLIMDGREKEHSGINFMRHVKRLKGLYAASNKKLYIAYGDPSAIIERLLQSHPIEEIVIQQDFTPYAIIRDHSIKTLANQYAVQLTGCIDHALIDFGGFQQYAGRTEPYRVFTPFFRKWSEYMHTFFRPPSSASLRNLEVHKSEECSWLDEAIPFDLNDYQSAEEPSEVLEAFLESPITSYHENRDRYAIDGTSSLSSSINVGAISIRVVYEAILAKEQAESWRRQLAWRDFYLYQSLYDTDYYRYEKKYDLSALSDRYWDRWHQAQTGIPIIDAAMTELNLTGRMPNRLRMVTAMFLTKNLQCPFTLGEQYFRNKLSDYDNALNRGGWLWCSSLGFDSAPYFRIMNPVTQSQTHDPTGFYIRKWLPELAHLSDKEIHLPQKHAIVDLKASRAEAIEVYKKLLGTKKA